MSLYVYIFNKIDHTSLNCPAQLNCLSINTTSYSIFVFSIGVFFHDHSRITGLQGKGEGISLTRHYHFDPLHRHLDICRAITAESSPLHIVSSSPSRTGEPLVSERKSLTFKLRAQIQKNMLRNL